MEEISVREILLRYGKWISSTEFAKLVAEKRNISIRQAYKLIKEAYERGEVQKHIFLDGSVWYGLPEFGPPSPTLVKREIIVLAPTLSNEKIIAALRGKIEELLRNFIREVLTQYCTEHHIKDWWVRAIPSDVRYRAETRKRDEIKKGNATIETPLINFTFFDDYKRIFEENWPIFQQYYKELSLSQVIGALNALENIRNIEAHRTREITIKDIVYFEFYGFRLLCRESDKAEFEKEIRSLSISYIPSPKQPLFQKITDRIVKTVKFPKKEDFDNGLIYHDKSTEVIVKDLLMNKRFCLIYGAPATRKTTFSINLGLEMIKQGYSVYYLEMKESPELSTDELLQEIKIHDNDKSIFIIDDCHNAIKETFELVNRAKREIERAMLLFVSRKVSITDPEYDYFKLFELEKAFIELKPSEEIFKGIINNFCSSFGVENYEQKIGNLKTIMEVCGYNFLFLGFLLNAWVEGARKKGEIEILSEITRKKFLEVIASKFRLREERNFLKLCALYQFEIPVPYDFLIMEGADKDIGRWMEEGIIFPVKNLGKECYIMAHSSLARMFLESAEEQGYLIFEMKGPSLNLEKYSANVLKKFVLNQEPLRGYLALRRVFSTKGIFEKQVLSFLFEEADVWKCVEEMVKVLSLGQVVSFIEALLWMEDKRKIFESKAATTVRSWYLKYNYKNLLERFKAASAHALLKYAPLLLRLKINLREFFNSFSIEDFQKIIKNSTLLSVRTVLYNLIKEPAKYQFEYLYLIKLELARKIVEALVAMPNDELYSWIMKTRSLYRLAGLLGNIQQLDKLLATKFVEKLSLLKLDELFEAKDPFAEKDGYSKLQSINYFLSKYISFTPEQRERIVNNINDITLSNLLLACKSLNELLFFVWNIWRENPEKAKRVVKKNFAHITNMLLRSREESSFIPAVGLLRVCECDIDSFILPDEKKISQIIEYYKTEGLSITALVLILVALKEKLPLNKYKENSGNIIDFVLRLLPTHFDQKNARILKDIIEVYQL